MRRTKSSAGLQLSRKRESPEYNKQMNKIESNAPHKTICRDSPISKLLNNNKCNSQSNSRCNSQCNNKCNSQWNNRCHNKYHNKFINLFSLIDKVRLTQLCKVCNQLCNRKYRCNSSWITTKWNLIEISWALLIRMEEYSRMQWWKDLYKMIWWILITMVLMKTRCLNYKWLKWAPKIRARD